MPKIQVHTAEYRRSHMKEPRGRGSWAFRVDTEIPWSPSMTYADAKAWARAQIAERAAGTAAPVVFVDVLP